jgi:hypothetical protein
MSDTPDPPPLAVPPEDAAEPPPASEGYLLFIGGGVLLTGCGGLLMVGSCMEAVGSMNSGGASATVKMTFLAGLAAIAIGASLMVKGVIASGRPR